MKVIKRFEPLSVMRIAAICYGVFGLLEGAVFTLVFALVGFPNTPGHPTPLILRTLFGGLGIIFFPVMFALIGAIGGGLMSAAYNVAARYVGGISVEVE